LNHNNFNVERLIETHPFGTFNPPGAEAIIIGTFPTRKRNRKFEFFYPNNQNVFWGLLASIYKYRFMHNEGESAVSERKYFAEQHHIALTDMLARAIRVKNNSSDKSFVPGFRVLLSISRSCGAARIYRASEDVYGSVNHLKNLVFI